jgi:hypothetical protein
MARPDLFNSFIPVTRQCLVCGKDVVSEENEGRDQLNRPVIFYSPASRYWTDEGVFCGVEHGFIYHKGKNTGT